MWFKKSELRKLSTAYFRRLDKTWKRMRFPDVTGDTHFHVLITPWGETAVPFFSAELALVLRLSGARVSIIGDTENLLSNVRKAEDRDIAKKLIARLARHLPVSNPGPACQPFPVDQEALRTLLFENLVKREKSEARAYDSLEAQPELFDAFRIHAETVANFLHPYREGVLILPGGIWALSGIHAAAARAVGMRYWTYDSGPAFLAYARDSAAAHHLDFAEAFQHIYAQFPGDSSCEKQVIQAARDRINTRRESRDEYKVQMQTDQTEILACDVLIALNYRLDSAAMCRNRIFPDVTTWLRNTLEWLKNETTAHVIVRQHPCERLRGFKSAEDYSWITQIAPDRIRFISCDEPVNTYGLLETCKVVLPHTSRVGIEAALLGKSVVVCTDTYYKACPFVISADSPEEYFAAIRACLNKKSSETSFQAAPALAYFLADFCTLNKTNFTPIPSDFWRWVITEPSVLLDLPEVGDFFTALRQGLNPISQAFKRIFPENGEPARP